MLYKDIFQKLQDVGFEYLVVGGMAVNLHGFMRATSDLDLLILLNEHNTKKFIDVIKELKYKPKIPVELEDFISNENRIDWIKNKNMKVFSVYNPEYELEHIDVLIEYSMDFEKVYKNKVIFDIAGIKVPIISIPDLIELKKEADRLIDRNDIIALEKIMRITGE